MAAGAKFVIDFVAEMKQFKAALTEVDAANKKLTSQITTSNNKLQKSERLSSKEQLDFHKKITKERKTQADLVAKNHKIFKAEGGFMKGVTGGRRGLFAGDSDPRRGSGKLASQISGHGLGGATRAVGGALAGIGAMAGGFVIGSLMAGYQKYVEYGLAKAGAIGLGTASGVKGQKGYKPPGAQAMAGIHGAGGGLGFSLVDKAEAVGTMGRSTGVLGPRELLQAQRATGMGAGEVGSVFSTLARSGVSFEGAGAKPGVGAGKGTQSAGGNMFSKLMAAGVASGIKQSRLGPEFLEPVSGLIQEQQSRRAEGVDPMQIAKVMTMFGRGGAPGMQGQYGAAVAAKLGGQLTGAAQGSLSADEKQAFSYRSVGFGKPGGNVGFEEATKKLEGGLTPELLRDVVKQVKEEHGEGFEAERFLASYMGGTTSQARGVMTAGEGPEGDEAINKILKETGTLEQQSLEQMKIMGGEIKHQTLLTDEGIKHGREIEAAVLAAEKLQRDLLEWLIRMAKDVAEILKWVNKTAGKDVSGDVKKEIQQAMATRDPEMRAKLLKEAGVKAHTAAVETGNASLIGSSIGASWRNWKRFGGKVLQGEFGEAASSSMNPWQGFDEQTAARTNNASAMSDVDKIEQRNSQIADMKRLAGITRAETPAEKKYIEEGGNKLPADLLAEMKKNAENNNNRGGKVVHEHRVHTSKNPREVKKLSSPPGGKNAGATTRSSD